MAEIIENIAIMIMAVVVLVGVGYLVLVVLGWGLKIKGGHREQEGLTDLWTEAKRLETNQDEPAEQKSDTQE